MSQGFLEIGLPTLIALVFVNFVWVWIVTAAKPPGLSEEEGIPDRVDPDWKSLGDEGPEGVRTNITEAVKPQTKVAG
jgi:hypothetical protein